MSLRRHGKMDQPYRGPGRSTLGTSLRRVTHSAASASSTPSQLRSLPNRALSSTSTTLSRPPTITRMQGADGASGSTTWACCLHRVHPTSARWLMRPGGLGQAATAPGRPVVLLTAGHDHGAHLGHVVVGGGRAGPPCCQRNVRDQHTDELRRTQSSCGNRGVGSELDPLPDGDLGPGRTTAVLGRARFPSRRHRRGRAAPFGGRVIRPGRPGRGPVLRIGWGGGAEVNGRLAHRAQCVPSQGQDRQVATAVVVGCRLHSYRCLT
jgi:hypothetical protein